MVFSIIDSIGRTPLVEIRHLNPEKNVKIYAKLEYMNPGGSVKDRAALYMINEAEKSGELTKDKTVIEATSGNTGIGLAMICAVKGYKIALTMAENASEERKSILRARGAQIILTPKHLGSDGAIEEAYRLARENPDQYFLTDQYNNDANWKAHYETTGPEIWDQTDGKISSLVATIGTSGTLMGLSRYLKDRRESIRVVCAEPYLGHKIQGLKNMKESYTPEILEKGRLDEKLNIDDDTAFEMARQLSRKEGLFVGMSSGAAMGAALEEAKKIKKGIVVAVFPDSGERYLSTDLFRVERNVVLSLYNTFSRKKTAFEPVDADKISVYTCGPTVHQQLNIGQLRRYVFTDLLVRYIEFQKVRVQHLVNITDYDDKTIQGASLSGKSLNDFTTGYVDQFKKDMAALKIRPADIYARVSEHFDEMIELSEKLNTSRHAYEKLHSLYFDVSSLSEYGEFANIDLDKIKIGATVDLDEYEKRNPKDFTLMKRVTLSELKSGVGIKTRWGNVRPSLHLQCAAIALKHLGPRFDIQTGSRELVFPHHENEVAIAKAASGDGLAKYWLHCDPVDYDGTLSAETIEALSLDDLIKQGWSAQTIRFFLASNHYRKPLILSKQALTQARFTLDKINRCLSTLGDIEKGTPYDGIDQLIYDIRKGFMLSMQDDLKISGVISSLLANIKAINRLISSGKIDRSGADRILAVFREIDAVLNIFKFESNIQYSQQAQDLIRERDEARNSKDYERADQIREKLIKMGVVIHDKKVTI